jgi:hypothetical protein
MHDPHLLTVTPKKVEHNEQCAPEAERQVCRRQDAEPLQMESHGYEDELAVCEVGAATQRKRSK